MKLHNLISKVHFIVSVAADGVNVGLEGELNIDGHFVPKPGIDMKGEIMIVNENVQLWLET